MKRFIPCLAPIIIAGFCGLYAAIPQFGLGVNQVCEMLATGNSRGLMMVLYETGAAAPGMAVGIGVLAFLIPTLKPRYLLAANVEYFGSGTGAALTLIGAFATLILFTLLSITFWYVIPMGLKSRMPKVHLLYTGMIAFLGIWMLMRVL